jgi:hypothetical protein
MKSGAGEVNRTLSWLRRRGPITARRGPRRGQTGPGEGVRLRAMELRCGRAQAAQQEQKQVRGQWEVPSGQGQAQVGVRYLVMGDLGQPRPPRPQRRTFQQGGNADAQ